MVSRASWFVLLCWPPHHVGDMASGPVDSSHEGPVIGPVIGLTEVTFSRTAGHMVGLPAAESTGPSGLLLGFLSAYWVLPQLVVMQGSGHPVSGMVAAGAGGAGCAAGACPCPLEALCQLPRAQLLTLHRPCAPCRPCSAQRLCFTSFSLLPSN